MPRGSAGPLDAMRARLPQMLADLGTLVNHESPSSSGEAVAASAEAVAVVGTRLLGAAPELIRSDGCTHLRWRLRGEGSPLLVLGHHDTVWPAGTLESRPFTLSGGVARGPGVLDMKAGLVQGFHAIAQMRTRTPLTILVTGDEELGSPTSRALVESEARLAGAALVLECAGPGGALKTSRKGVSTYEVTVTGRAAHAGLEPDVGVNAAVEAALAVLAIRDLGDPGRGTTVTPTLVTAGTSRNTVPARATVAVDARARTAAELERVDIAVRALSPRLAGADLRVEGGPNRMPLEPHASAALFERASRVAESLGIGGLRASAVGGGSDGNLTAGVGTPTLDGLGAVGGGPHAEDEHVLVDQMPARAALLAALLEDLAITGLPGRPT